EILVAGLRLDQHWQTEDGLGGRRTEGGGRGFLVFPSSVLRPLSSGERQLRADDRLQAGFLRGEMKARSAVDAVAIEQRERGIVERRGAIDERLGQRRTAEQGEG